MRLIVIIYAQSQLTNFPSLSISLIGRIYSVIISYDKGIRIFKITADTTTLENETLVTEPSANRFFIVKRNTGFPQFSETSIKV